MHPFASAVEHNTVDGGADEKTEPRLLLALIEQTALDLLQSEQDRPDVAAARTAWADNRPKLDPDRLVIIDETGTSTKMARLRGRAPRGERLKHFNPIKSLPRRVFHRLVRPKET